MYHSPRRADPRHLAARRAPPYPCLRTSPSRSCRDPTSLPPATVAAPCTPAILLLRRPGPPHRRPPSAASSSSSPCFASWHAITASISSLIGLRPLLDAKTAATCPRGRQVLFGDLSKTRIHQDPFVDFVKFEHRKTRVFALLILDVPSSCSKVRLHGQVPWHQRLFMRQVPIRQLLDYHPVHCTKYHDIVGPTSSTMVAVYDYRRPLKTPWTPNIYET